MIRGIDSQIMIQRSTDQARRVGEQIGNIEHNKDFSAMVEKERTAHETKSVTQLEHAEHLRVRKKEETDKDGRKKDNNKGKKKEGGNLGSNIDIDV